MRRRLAGAGAAAACGTAALLLGGCALSLQSLPKAGGAPAASYPLHAVFSDVLNLPEGAQVRVGPEVVGDVSGIAAQDFAAHLTLAIDDGVRIPAGTTAQVRFDNPLGDEYILLSEPSGTPVGGDLAAGATIPESATSTAPSVEDTFGALSLVLNGGGLNQLQVIIHELNDTFAGNQPQIRSFLTTIDRAVTTVAGGRASLDAALAAIALLSKDLAAGGGTITRGLQTIAPAIGVLAGENRQISSLLQALSGLGQAGTAVAAGSGAATDADIRELLPLVEQLESVSQQLAPDLAAISRFEAETPRIAPGAYLQVNAIADVLLPAGAYEPSVGAGAGGAAPPPAAATGQAAVADLLAGGLT